jgi:hypothetical protein
LVQKLDPTDITILDGSSVVAVVPHEDLITGGPTPWATVPVPGYLPSSQYPAGGFFITQAVIDHTGPHPHVDPATTPEPGTLTLLGMGMAGMAA